MLGWVTRKGRTRHMSDTAQHNDAGWGSDHSIDARYRMPWFGGPIYVRVMAGRERRPGPRIKAHNEASIRRSMMNVLLFAFGACIFYTAVGAALLITSAVLQ